MPARVRTALALPACGAALLALGAGLAACGGHGSLTTTVISTRTAPPGSSGATPKKPSQPGSGALTAARAAAFANAVNLTAADVPGFTVSTRGNTREGPAEKRSQQRLLACVGAPSASDQASAERSSPQFTHPSLLNQSVSSSVSFLASAAAAQQELALLRSARAHRCLARYLQEVFAGRQYGSSVIRHVSIAQGVPPAPGTSGGFGWRISADVALKGIAVPFYLDVLGFVYGPSEVRLLSSSLVVPFPASAEEHLYRLLLSRATAHPL
jgi:hypothetical protein